MPPQKSINDWQPIDINKGINDWQPIQIDRASQPVYEDDPSMLEKFSDSWINKPISRIPTYLADLVAEPMMQFGESGNEWYRSPFLYGGAFLHNVGEGVSGLTTPMNLATAGTLAGAGALGRGALSAGLSTTAKEGARQLIPAMGKFAPMPTAAGRLATAGRLLSAPTAVAGVGHMATAENLPEFLMGGLETFGGGMGMRYKVPGPLGTARGLDPSAPPRPIEATPPPPGVRMEGPRPLPDLVSRESFPPEMRDLFRQSGHTIEGTNAEGYDFMARPGAHSPLDTPISQTPDLPLQESAIPNIVAQRGWTTEQIGYYEGQGLVRGGVLPDGRAYMIRPGTPKPVAGQIIPEPPPIAPMADPAGQARVGGELEDITFNADEGFTVPARQLTRARIDSLREQGYEQVGINDRGEAVFQLMDEDDVLPIRRRGDEGSIDPQLLMAPYQALRRFTGPGLIDNPRSLDIGGTDILGSMEMRGQNQLENIGNAGGRLAGDIDLGPRPTMESFDPASTDKLGERVRTLIGRLRGRRESYGLSEEATSTDPIAQRIRADLQEIQNATTGQEARAISARWHQEWNRAIAANDEPGRMYAGEMADASGARQQELYGRAEQPQPVRGQGEGPIEVFDPRDGVPIARFQTEEEARMFIAAHPGGDRLDYSGPPTVMESMRPRSAESQAFTEPVIESTIDEGANRRLGEIRGTENRSAVAARIRATTTESELTSITNRLAEELGAARTAGNQPRIDAITDLLSEASDRRAEIRSGAVTPPDLRELVTQLRTRIEAATDTAELDRIVDDYRSQFNNVNTSGNITNRILTREVTDAISNKRNELRGPTDNPPITFGPQAPYKGPMKLNRDQLSRLEGAGGIATETPQQTARELKRVREDRIAIGKIRGKIKTILSEHGGQESSIPSNHEYWNLKQQLDQSGTWEDFGRSVVRSAREGTPGLNVEDHSSSYGDKRYHVIYRSLEGKPVMVAKITESSSHGGRRVVTAMGMDRNVSAGLQARAFKNVAMKLLEIGAGEASDTISQFTANAIRRARKLVGNDVGAVGQGVGDVVRRVEEQKAAHNMFNWMLDKLEGKPPAPPVVPSATGGGPTPTGKKKPSFLRELYNFPRAITTTLDLSAPLRQGLPLIFTKEWRNSWSQMVSALKDEGAFQKTLSDLRARPIFQSKMVNGKVVKSFAEQAGIKLMDLDHNLGRREEATASTWVEKILPGARASNRAYTAFLNQLRADSFENLLKAASKDAQTGIKGARNPYTDMAYAKEIADFVNTATGRGPLKTYVPSIKGGTTLEGWKPHLKERSIEQHTKLFTDLIFSPRLMASRVRMLNPATYMMASPFVRRQYLNSLLSVAGAWGTTAVLAKMAGADVSTDPTSADFGKIKIGNTRIDAAAGFQQYLVSAAKFISGHTTSSNTGRDFELGQGYRAETRKDIAERFGVNKLHPVLKFAYDLADASTHQPFQVGDRALQLFVPLIVQDTFELMKEDPSLLPLLVPIGLGAGSQTYDKGESISKFIPKNRDFTFGGGSWYPGDKR